MRVVDTDLFGEGGNDLPGEIRDEIWNLSLNVHNYVLEFDLCDDPFAATFRAPAGSWSCGEAGSEAR